MRWAYRVPYAGAAARAAWLLILVAATACGADELADYSVATTKQVRMPGRFAVERPGWELRRVLSLGSADGDSTESFAFIADAAFGPGGSVYVADAGQHRIVVFDSAGRFVRTIGRRGQGPGEFLAPTSLAVITDTLFVYDSEQGRVGVFDTSGAFHRYLSPPSAWAVGLRPSGRGTLFFTVAADSFLVHEVGTDGVPIGRYVPQPTIERRLPPEARPAPGPLCVDANGFAYANRWRYEVVSYALPGGTESRARQYPSPILRPASRDGMASLPVAPASGMLGFLCLEAISVLGYLDLESGRIHYDILDDHLRPVGRLRFWRDREPDYPGFLVAGRGNRLLAFRSRPFPQVGIWEIRPVAE